MKADWTGIALLLSTEENVIKAWETHWGYVVDTIILNTYRNFLTEIYLMRLRQLNMGGVEMTVKGLQMFLAV